MENKEKGAEAMCALMPNQSMPVFAQSVVPLMRLPLDKIGASA